MSIIQPVLTRVDGCSEGFDAFRFFLNTIRKGGETYDVLCMQRENGNGTKRLGKSDISKETKTNEGKGRNTCGLSGRMHICMYVCMYVVWSSHIAEYGSTG